MHYTKLVVSYSLSGWSGIKGIEREVTEFWVLLAVEVFWFVVSMVWKRVQRGGSPSLFLGNSSAYKQRLPRLRQVAAEHKCADKGVKTDFVDCN